MKTRKPWTLKDDLSTVRGDRARDSFVSDSQCNLILEWSKSVKWFDTRIVESIQRDRSWKTERQIDAINNIFTKFKVLEWAEKTLS